METNDKRPEDVGDYIEAEKFPRDQRQTLNPQEKDLENKKGDEVKATGADIENLPEIKPARPGVLG